MAAMQAAQQQRLDPASVLGYPVGADRRLPHWATICGYFRRLAAASDRVRVTELGPGTLGAPLLLVTLAAPETLAQLDRYQAIQRVLADPRRCSPAAAEPLIAGGKTIVLLTCGIHATEVGATLMSLELAYDLASRDDAEVRQVLDNTILLLMPSLNPDGHDMVAAWYQRTLGTPWEGTHPPGIYHPYTGHDLNRDWFMFTQAETRLVVEQVHNVWRPHIVYDLHQMAADGPRFVLPPYIDPIDPNVDPILQQELAALGLTMATELTAEGKAGVATNVIFDAYSPSRAYQHYHGGVRILSEAASVHIATPVSLRAEDLRETRSFNPRLATWNHPLPWRGGDWRLRDIIDYEKTAALALLSHAARYRDRWLRHFYTVLRHACQRAGGAPYAYVVPANQRDPGLVAELLAVLRTGGVEVEQAERAFTAGGVVYPAGSFVIRLGQPFGAYAKTLLEVQRYPDLRLYPGGPPRPPYDITAHTLPLQMGVEAIAVSQPFEARLQPVTDERPAAPAIVAGARYGYAIAPQTNDTARLVNRLLAAGVTVHRLPAGRAGRAELAPGTWLVHGTGAGEALEAAGRGLALAIQPLAAAPAREGVRVRAPRLGLYRSWRHTATDEGWTRFVLEGYEFPLQALRDHDVRQGRLRARFDALILPSQPVADLVDGNREGEYPPDVAGGLGLQGFDHLRAFVEEGGVLIALGQACEAAIAYLYLPVSNALAGLPPEEFYSPGSLLRVLVEPDHPLGYGFRRQETVMFVHGPAFEVRSGSVAVRYPLSDPVLSGWLLGAQHLADRAAIVETAVGRGRVVLIGPRVQFRAQTRGSYRFLFNAIFAAATERVGLPDA
jgi:hypothetical protein